MIVKTLLAALVAGLVAGLFMTAAQTVRVKPLILHAEEYEGQAPEGAEPSGDSEIPTNQTTPNQTAPSQTPAGQTHTDHSDAGHAGFLDSLAALSLVTPAYAHETGEAHEEGGMLFGMSRFSGTLLANLVTGAGFSLLLAGFSLASGHPITLSNGATWGAFGWLAVHLLPALGLPPELPGFPAADLGARQIWWVATIVLSVAGLYLLALRREPLAKIAGLVLIAIPHLYGAPQPDDITSPVPAVLGAEFAVAALATTLAFWLVLGLVSGAINNRMQRAT